MVQPVQEVLQGQQLLELLPIEVQETEQGVPVRIEVLAVIRGVHSRTEVQHQDQAAIGLRAVEVRAQEVVEAIEVRVAPQDHLPQAVGPRLVEVGVVVLVGVAVEGEINSIKSVLTLKII